jgi:hypothetical protein
VTAESMRRFSVSEEEFYFLQLSFIPFPTFLYFDIIIRFHLPSRIELPQREGAVKIKLPTASNEVT